MNLPERNMKMHIIAYILYYRCRHLLKNDTTPLLTENKINK